VFRQITATSYLLCSPRAFSAIHASVNSVSRPHFVPLWLQAKASRGQQLLRLE